MINDGRLVSTVTDSKVFDELGPPVPLAHRPQARSPERPSVCPTARIRRRFRVTSACWEPTSARTTDAHSAKAGDKLGKFANSIERVSARKGRERPRGGIGEVCVRSHNGRLALVRLAPPNELEYGSGKNVSPRNT